MKPLNSNGVTGLFPDGSQVKLYTNARSSYNTKRNWSM